MFLKGIYYVLYLVFLLSEVFYDLLDHYSFVYKFWGIVYSIELIEMFKFVQISYDVIRLDHRTYIISLTQHIFIQKFQIVRTD